MSVGLVKARMSEVMNLQRESGAGVEVRPGLESLEARRLLTSYVVDTTVDESDGDYSAGDLSLREAIELANTDAAEDTITFSTVAFDGGGTITLGGAQLEISEDLVIGGSDGLVVTIDADGNSRVFEIEDNLSVAFSYLVITGGNDGQGAGILKDEGGDLTLTHVVVKDNHSPSYGGGIYTKGGQTVVFEDVTIEGNSNESRGGGYYAADRSHISMARVNFIGNTSDSMGGGLYVGWSSSLWGDELVFRDNIVGNGIDLGANGGGLYSHNATLVIDRSTFQGNVAVSGAGADVDGSTTISNSKFIDNLGVAIQGDFSLANSLVQGNIGGVSGRGLITESVIIDNHTSGKGGGVSGRFEIVDSEIIGNTAGEQGGGVYSTYFSKIVGSLVAFNSAAEGGGLYSRDDLEIYNSTFSENQADNGGGLYLSTHSETQISSSTIVKNNAIWGGGIHHDDDEVLVLNNSIVSGNESRFAVSDIRGPVTSGANNLIGDAASSGGLIDGMDGNIVGISGHGTQNLNAILDVTLRENGGPTKNHALLRDSLAVGAGNASLLPADTLDLDKDGDLLEVVPVDQTGQSRILGTLDIGAVEYRGFHTPLTVQVDVPENHIGAVHVIAGNDDEQLSYTIAGGMDHLLFDLNVATGEIAFISSPDYENPLDSDLDNVYELIVQVNDDGMLSIITFQISVLDNTHPVIFSDDHIQIVENERSIFTVIAADEDGHALTYSLSGGVDQSDFTIDQQTGELAFVSVPDFESPADQNRDNQYQVNVTVSDGEDSFAKLLTVEVTDNLAPVIFAPRQHTINEGESHAFMIDAKDVEDDRLVYSLVGGRDQSHFSVGANSGVVSFLQNPEYSAPHDHNADNKYELIIQVADGENTSVAEVNIEVLPVHGETYIVDYGNDEDDGDYSEGDLSLREAIALANADKDRDTIIIECDSWANLTLGELVVSEDVFIDYVGCSNDLPYGNYRYQLNSEGSRHFKVTDGATLELNRVNLVYGEDVDGGAVWVGAGSHLILNNARLDHNVASGRGGAIYMNRGAVTMNNVSIEYGDAQEGGAIYSNHGHVNAKRVNFKSNEGYVNGGGIYAQGGEVDLLYSEFSANRSYSDLGGEGGAIFSSAANIKAHGVLFDVNNTWRHGGAIYARGGTLDLFSSTLVGNRAGSDGGAVYVDGTQLSIVHATFVENQAEGRGGGVAGTGSLIAMDNSIVAGNVATDLNDLALNVTSGGHNIIGNADSSGGLIDGAHGNYVGINGRGTRYIHSFLKKKENNGGFTHSYMLTDDSIAIDAADNQKAIELSTDQRGLDRIAGSQADIGALEIRDKRFVVDVTIDEDDGDYTRGDLSLREAIHLSNAIAGRHEIVFDDEVFAGGGRIDLKLGQLHVTGDVDIFGRSDQMIHLNGSEIGRVFNFERAASALSYLTIQGATYTRYGAGAIYSLYSWLLLDNLQVLDNSTSGLSLQGSDVIIRETLIQDNLNYGIDIGSGGNVLVADTGIVGNEWGISSRSDIQLVDSYVTGNRRGGIGLLDRGNAEILSSLVANNAGIGLSASNNKIEIANSTFSQNTGWGIFLQYIDAIITNSTIVKNGGSEWSGGVHVGRDYNDIYAEIYNTIIAGNVNDSGVNDLWGDLEVGFNNLIGDAFSSGGLVDGVNGNIVGVDGSGVRDLNTILNPILQDNGGPTLTHHLVSGSPAWEKGDAIWLPSDDLDFDGDGIYVETLPHDQRGVARVAGLQVDIGATEGGGFLSLIQSQIVENATYGTVLGTVQIFDANLNRIGGTFEIQSDLFQIDSDTGLISVANSEMLNHEIASSHTLIVRAVDTLGKRYEKSFEIAILDINEAPISLWMDSQAVDENAAGGTVVGAVMFSDEDVGDSHEFKLANDAGGRFEIDGDGVLTVVDSLLLDHEAATKHSISVEVTDGDGLSEVSDFSITVTDVNDKPSDIQIDNLTLMARSENGIEVGTISAIDEDGHALTYELINDSLERFSLNPTTGLLAVAQSSLIVGEMIGVEVMVTDSEGLSAIKNFELVLTPNNGNIIFYNVPEHVVQGENFKGNVKVLLHNDTPHVIHKLYDFSVSLVARAVDGSGDSILQTRDFRGNWLDSTNVKSKPKHFSFAFTGQLPIGDYQILAIGTLVMDDGVTTHELHTPLDMNGQKRFVSSAAPFVDLTAETELASKLPASHPEGERLKVKLKVYVRNDGNVEMPAAVTSLHVFLEDSLGARHGPPLFVNPNLKLSKMKPGQVKAVNVSFDMPADTALGDFHFAVDIDGLNLIDETNEAGTAESNNSSVTSETILIEESYLDLTTEMGDRKGVRTYSAGKAIKDSRSLRVGNQGNVPTAKSALANLRIEIYDALDQLVATQLIENVKLGNLKPGKSKNVAARMSFDSLAVGDYRTVYTLEPVSFTDTDLSDNTFEQVFQVR